MSVENGSAFTRLAGPAYVITRHIAVEIVVIVTNEKIVIVS